MPNYNLIVSDPFLTEIPVVKGADTTGIDFGEKWVRDYKVLY